MHEEKGNPYLTITLVFIVLAVLTAVEYLVTIYFNSPIILMILALAKAGLVVNYFMHIYRLWREDEH